MQGVAKLLKDLEDRKEKIASRASKGLKSLCIKTVDAMSEAKPYQDNGVSVKYEMTGDGAIISATHPELGFIEFGTGIWHNQGTEYGAQLGFTPASWSENHAQWLTDPKKLSVGHGMWYFNGWQVGNAPADAFGIAEKTLREYMEEYMVEAFKK